MSRRAHAITRKHYDSGNYYCNKNAHAKAFSGQDGSMKPYYFTRTWTTVHMVNTKVISSENLPDGRQTQVAPNGQGGVKLPLGTVADQLWVELIQTRQDAHRIRVWQEPKELLKK